MPEAKPTPPALSAPERSEAYALHAAWQRDPDQFARSVLASRAMTPDETLEWLARAVGVHLLEAGCNVATAESCTGGGIGSALTGVAGSSAWVEGGIISYSNASKVSLLGVPAELIARHGAVSLPVVRAMALGAQLRLGAACSVAVSGVAGPGGGTPAKPVGTVCLAWAGLSDPALFAQTLWFPGDRAAVRAATVLVALIGLLGVSRPRRP